MQIAKTPNEIKELAQNGIKDLSSFARLPLKTPKKPVKKTSSEWATYKFKVGSLSFAAKQRYEWFCAGFLMYYDGVVRNGAVDHTMWFQWGTNKVTIHLSPSPDSGKDYLNPAGTTDPPKPPPPPPPPLS